MVSIIYLDLLLPMAFYFNESRMQMIIDYVNRIKKQEVETAGDAVKAGICAALCVVVLGLLVVML